eukprot:scaffold45641_cov212-Skeletonema_marinoi.AAC.1
MKYTLRRSSESSSYRVEQNTNCTFLDANMRPNYKSGSSFFIMINVDPDPEFLAEERLGQAHSSLRGEAGKLEMRRVYQ